MVLFFPVVWLTSCVVNLFSLLWKRDTQAVTITEEELENILDTAEDEGVIDENETELLQSALEFSDMDAGDILTPRIDVVGFEVGDSTEEILRIINESQFSRYPVYERTIDHVVGILYVKHLLHELVDKKEVSLRELMLEPVFNMIEELKAERDYDEVIYMSPDGEILNQNIANELSLKGNIIILCGHYKGIDYRIREHLITKEVSIGDFVLTGGELAAACMTDAIVRVIPGAIGDEQSALSDSFQDNLLAAPVYTRPADYNGWKVPEILLSGHEAKIKEWELQQAFERTKMLRPDLLKKK